MGALEKVRRAKQKVNRTDAPEMPGDDARPQFKLTDLGNAERLIDRHGSDLRFCNRWLAWDGKRWCADDTGAVYRAAMATVRGMYATASTIDNPDARQAMVKWARDSESRSRIEAMVSLAKSLPGVTVKPSQLDSDPRLFNCANGTIDLSTGALREHRRTDLITKISPVEYDPAAKCPTWDRFLDEVLPDPDVRGFVQRFFGYGLTGLIRERVIVFMYGLGANGKSVLLVTVRTAMGEYAQVMSPDLLMAKRGEVHPTEVADLFGSRLAVCSEVNTDRAFDEGLVKRLTGNEPIKARRMREDFFEFAPTWKLTLAANHRPEVRDTTDSIWDRIRQVPFTVRIPPERQDRALGEKLLNELPGVLRWCVEGCLLWQQEGLNEPPAVMAATSDYRREQDHVARFLAECCVEEGTAIVGATPLFEAFTGWCRSENERPLSQTRFGSQLRERGFRQAERDARGRKQWDGLRLNDVGARLASDARTARTVRGHFRHERDSFSRESLMPKSGSDCSDHSADWGQA